MEDLGCHMGLRNSREVFLKRERTQWKWYIKYNSKASKETSIFRNSCASSFIITNRRLELHQDICLNETCNHLHHDHWFNVRTCLVQPTKKLRNLKSQFLQRIQAIAHRNQAHQDFQISLTGHISRSATSKCKIFHQAVARHLQIRNLLSYPQKMYFCQMLKIWDSLASKLANMTKIRNTSMFKKS